MNRAKIEYLKQLLLQEQQEDYPVASRIHPLHSLPNCFVKRDDELGFSISGTKFRKYRTLIPYLRQYQEVVVTGGAFSNHVLGITQLLLENGIKMRLALTGSPPEMPNGNYLFLQMLLPGNSITWTQDRLPQAERSDRVCILPEGGSIFPSFLGALSLPLDIERNEQETGVVFEHLLMEAGTGLSAAALLLGFSFIEKETECHVLLMAGSEDRFLEQLRHYHVLFENWLGEKCPFPTRFECERPSSAASFGSTNAALFDYLHRFARTEGFFLDPIYSGKLFYYAEEKMGRLSGCTLVLHSGGALTLAGFQSQLARCLF